MSIQAGATDAIRGASNRLTYDPKVGQRSSRHGSSGGHDLEPAVETMAEALGWFSIGLGVAEVVAPNALARLIGMPPSPTLLRLYGLREIAAGVGILSKRHQAGWLAARVAGDGLDLATLLASFASRRSHPGRLAVATAAVAGVTVIDVMCAQAMCERGS